MSNEAASIWIAAAERPAGGGLTGATAFGSGAAVVRAPRLRWRPSPKGGASSFPHAKKRLQKTGFAPFADRVAALLDGALGKRLKWITEVGII
ncbi:MAG: hypothetical protein M3Q08_08025 [Pseudomonadota bacterium]|nr:hypothetical protein [Pseudomonadota bacterium]